mgnify:FL=1
MFDYQVQPVFSTPIVSVNIGKVDPMTLAWIKNLRYEHKAVGQTDDEEHLPFKERGFNIINAKQLRLLRSNIMKAVAWYSYELLDVTTDVEFVFTTSWINRLEKDENIDRHPHTNSVISGIYYIDVTPNSSPITFHKNRTHLSTWPLSTKPLQAGRQWNQYNTEQYTYMPQNGLCILFPSHLEHSVEHSTDDKYRYGLAFNLFARGKLGENSGSITI